MSGDGFPEHPPKPRLTLRVGVTGKRAVTEDPAKDVRAALDNIFEALGKLLVDCRNANLDFFSKDAPLLRIISGMAEGADQIAAEAATTAHQHSAERKVETRLAAILPFVQEEYEKDFRRDPFEPNDAPDRPPEVTAKVVGKFQTLLDDDAVETVLEIDDEALRDPANKEFRDRAYANLGDVLLEHTDLLVAISNDKFGGAGGTVDVLSKALELKIPAIKVSLVTGKVHVLHAAGSDAANPAPVEGQEMIGAALPSDLADLITRTLEPPQNTPSQDAAHHSGHEGALPMRDRLAAFFGETFMEAGAPADWIFKAFRNAVSVKPGPNVNLAVKLIAVVPAFVSAWRSYPRDLQKPDERAAKIWPDTFDSLAPRRVAHVRKVLALRYGWADVTAIRYADATRSAHIIIAALGAFAVLMALFPLVLWDVPEELALVIKMAFLAVEWVVLWIAWQWFFKPAHEGRWQQRFLEYRAVAELLRHERFIYALGAADRLGRAADRTWSEPDAWVGWYVRATLRELGFPGNVIGAPLRRNVITKFRDNELEGVEGQIGYNDSTATRFNTIDRRLDKFIHLAFQATVWAAALGIVAMLIFGVLLWQIGPEDRLEHWIHVVKPWLTVVAAFIPALIAAIHGIRFQIDFKGTALRTASTGRELLKVKDAMEAALAAPEPSPGRKHALALVREANEAMSQDLAGWSSVYRGKGPEI
jgi:hypothetical protein